MKRVIAISLALILLVSNISFTIGKHYCGGEVVMNRIMFGETHLDCGMAEMDMACDVIKSNGLKFNKVPCCENQYQIFQADIDYISDALQSNLNIDFIVAFVHAAPNLVLFSKAVNSFYSEYSPPPLIKDIPVLFQTFLI